MIDDFSFVDLDESTSGAAHILKIEFTILEVNFGMITTDAFIENEYLVGAVSSNFCSLLFD